MRRAHLIDLSLLLMLAGPLVAAEPSKFTLAQSGAAADPLTVLGPASVCADKQIALWNGASATQLQCSTPTVTDDGEIYWPSGGARIVGGTGDRLDVFAGDRSLEAALAVYNTWTDNSNYARLQIDSEPGWFHLLATSLGNPDPLGLKIGNSATSWEFLTTGNFRPGVTDSYDLGSSARRVRDLWLQRNIYFEGATDNAYETIIGVVDPTADRTITLPNASGTVLLNVKVVTPDIDGETTTLANSATVWTNTGDGDGEAITLLNDPTVGTNYCFAVDVAQTITVAPSTGETLYYGTDNCAVSLTSNAIGSTLCVTAITGGSGAKWFTMSHEGSWTCND